MKNFTKIGMARKTQRTFKLRYSDNFDYNSKYVKAFSEIESYRTNI